MEEWRSMKHKGEHTFKCIESYTNNKKITHCTYLFLELPGMLTRAHVSEMFFNSEMEMRFVQNLIAYNGHGYAMVILKVL